jgi:hypothetical protein
MADGDETAPGDKPPAEEPSKKHDQAFFLALAKKGKEAWNAWRRDPANTNVHVTFAGVDFSVPPRDQINFERFEFGDFADFSGCKWQGVTLRKFGGNTKAFWVGRAYFVGAAFGGEANFAGATVGSSASFAGATFGSGALFIGAAFGSDACFDGASFDEATFAGAALGHGARFDGAHFKGRIYFTGQTKEHWGTNVLPNVDRNEEAQIILKKRHEDSWKLHASGPDRFLYISFVNARFDGEAVFPGRSFEWVADFTNARFYHPPDFDATTNASRIDFTGAHIGFVPPGKRPWTKYWTEDSRIPLRLRAIRKIAEDSKHHDLERNLYIDERRAERGVYWRQLSDELKKAPWQERPRIALRLTTHIFWILVMCVYGALSNYGRNPVLPLAWLFGSVFIFHCGYALILAPLKEKVDPANKVYYDQAVCMLALGNAVPFVGHLSIDAGIKKSLYCPGDVCGDRAPIPPLGIQGQVIVQNVVSIALIFFFGLALRNYFKIKMMGRRGRPFRTPPRPLHSSFAISPATAGSCRVATRYQDGLAFPKGPRAARSGDAC